MNKSENPHPLIGTNPHPETNIHFCGGCGTRLSGVGDTFIKKCFCKLDYLTDVPRGTIFVTEEVEV
jgi:hypothetical protein